MSSGEKEVFLVYSCSTYKTCLSNENGIKKLLRYLEVSLFINHQIIPYIGFGVGNSTFTTSMENKLASSSILQQPRCYKFLKMESCGKGGRNLFLRFSSNSSSCQKLQVHATQESNYKEVHGAAKRKTPLELKHGSKHQMPIASFDQTRSSWLVKALKYLLRKVKMSKSYRGIVEGLLGCSSSSQASSQMEAYFSVPVIPPMNI
ncbi:hypothetical protein LIER_34751 [Lithospermum erythrorhizon]|uniref:Uncharacterized protein n=1 Tax=Lithospermum erythrorhizon TaxID=34254 RepID=A0AAV3S252_LITER